MFFNDDNSPRLTSPETWVIICKLNDQNNSTDDNLQNTNKVFINIEYTLT